MIATRSVVGLKATRVRCFPVLSSPEALFAIDLENVFIPNASRAERPDRCLLRTYWYISCCVPGATGPELVEFGTSKPLSWITHGWIRPRPRRPYPHEFLHSHPQSVAAKASVEFYGPDRAQWYVY